MHASGSGARSAPTRSVAGPVGPPGVHRAEARRGERDEHHRVRCHVDWHALPAAGKPGIDQLPDIALVLPGARRADGSAPVAAAHEDHPARLAPGRVQRPQRPGLRLGKCLAPQSDRPPAVPGLAQLCEPPAKVIAGARGQARASAIRVRHRSASERSRRPGHHAAREMPVHSSSSRAYIAAIRHDLRIRDPAGPHPDRLTDPVGAHIPHTRALPQRSGPHPHRARARRRLRPCRPARAHPGAARSWSETGCAGPRPPCGGPAALPPR